MNWTIKTGRFINGSKLILGVYQVASVDYDSCSLDSNLKYKVTILLPGIEPKNKHYSTELEAKILLKKLLKFG